MRNALRENKGSLTSDIGKNTHSYHTHKTVQEHTEDGLTLAHVTDTKPPGGPVSPLPVKKVTTGSLHTENMYDHRGLWGTKCRVM